MMPTKEEFSNRIIQLSGTTFSDDKEWTAAISKLYDSLTQPAHLTEEQAGRVEEYRQRLRQLDSGRFRANDISFLLSVISSQPTKVERIDYEKWAKEFHHKFREQGVMNGESFRNFIVDFLRSFAQRVIASEGMISREEVKRVLNQCCLVDRNEIAYALGIPASTLEREPSV